MSRSIGVQAERWPLARPFSIARGTKTAADVVVVTLRENGATGRGECVPYARYGESVDTVVAAIARCAAAVEAGMDAAGVQQALPAGAARNALDCALWDLRAKQAGRRVWELAGLPPPRETLTAETIALAGPQEMAEAAAQLRDRPLLKVKLGAEGILERMRAVRAAAPASRLIVDANEGWSRDLLDRVGEALVELAVAVVEQPVPARDDGTLHGYRGPLALCADESCHTAGDLERLPAAYGMINIKLDKTGGLTGAIALLDAARARGLQVMVGCMVCTSLGIAPALLLAGHAQLVDLDGPQWLARDRTPKLSIAHGKIAPPPPALWG